jgi:hypothetical protein
MLEGFNCPCEMWGKKEWKKKKKKSNENCQISIIGFQFVVKRIIQE